MRYKGYIITTGINTSTGEVQTSMVYEHPRMKFVASFVNTDGSHALAKEFVDNHPLPPRFVVEPSRGDRGAWLVRGQKGGFIAIFPPVGGRARQRAEEYAAWLNDREEEDP